MKPSPHAITAILAAPIVRAGPKTRALPADHATLAAHAERHLESGDTP